MDGRRGPPDRACPARRRDRAVLGVTPAFLVNTATYAVSAVVLVGLVLAVPLAAEAAADKRGWRRRALEGVGVITGTPLLRLLATIQLFAALSVGATSALLIVLATEHLGVGPDGFGVMLGAIGVGAVVGPLLLTRVTTIRAARHPCSDRSCCAGSAGLPPTPWASPPSTNSAACSS